MAMIEVRRAQSGLGVSVGRRRPERGSIGLIALVFLLAGCQDAAAQEGVVLEVTTKTAEETFPIEAALGAQLGADNIDALKVVLSPVVDMLADVLGRAKVGGAWGEFEKALYGEPQAQLSSVDYTVYLRDNLMAVAARGAPVMVWEIADGSTSKMWFLDPATGQPIPIPALKAGGIVLGKVAGGDVGESTNVSKPTATGRTREILGHTAREYTYRLELNRTFGPNASTAGGMVLRIVIEGEAWVAPESPFRDEIAAFYRNFASGIGSPGGTAVEESGHLSGLTSHMAAISELGVPLVTSESVTTYVIGGDDTTPLGAPLSKAATSSWVTKIGRAPIPDEQYYGSESEAGASAKNTAGVPPAASEPPSCDCSCDAYAKLQELSKKSREEQAADPTAMATAMCASRCAMKWIGCKR